MDDFYKDMQDVATNLISEFKQGQVVYIDLKPGDGPADDPGPAVETRHPVEGTARGVSFRYIDKTNIVATDLQVTISGKNVEPKITGFMEVDGVRHKIIRVVSKPAAGIPVAFTVIFRK